MGIVANGHCHLIECRKWSKKQHSLSCSGLIFMVNEENCCISQLKDKVNNTLTLQEFFIYVYIFCVCFLYVAFLKNMFSKKVTFSVNEFQVTQKYFQLVILLSIIHHIPLPFPFLVLCLYITMCLLPTVGTLFFHFSFH